MKFSDKVVYQIYPKSFYDTNGDGWGDLAGVTCKLDYLKQLGIDYIWLTPFFPSPQRDNGYDVADYRNIDPRYGTMADLEELIRQADRRGIGIMLDMVFNHTSTDHEWFQKALAGDRKYLDYYIFKDGGKIPTNWVSKFGGPAWKYVPSLGKWYLHLFDESQADLNWDNPEVRAELADILRYWKAKGIKGFRFDVVNLVSKPASFTDDDSGDGRRFYTDGPHIHEYLKELIKNGGISDMITVGEMSSTSIAHCLEYSGAAKGELSMCFSFHHLKVDYKDGQKWELMAPDYHHLKELFYNWQTAMAEGDAWNALFWCNHDQPRIISRFGDENRYFGESGKMLATAIHLMRGTPYIYQGEEIGMTNAHFTSIDQYQDVESRNYFRILLEEGKTQEQALDILAARSRDNSRTPMQWDGSETAGFTTGRPWIGLSDNADRINVEASLKDPGSIFFYYQDLIRFRKESPAVREGDIHFLFQDMDNVFAYIRELDGEKVLTLCNLTAEAVPLSIEAEGEKRMGNYDDLCIRDGMLELRPYEAVVFHKKQQ